MRPESSQVRASPSAALVGSASCLLLALALSPGHALAEPVQFEPRQPVAEDATWREVATWRSEGRVNVQLGPITVRNRDVDDLRAHDCTVALTPASEQAPGAMAVRCASGKRVESGEDQGLQLAGLAATASREEGPPRWRREGGGRLKKDQRKFLERSFRFEGDDVAALVLPERPVDVGDRWAIPWQPIVDALGGAERFTLDEQASHADVQLVELLERDGEAFGRFAFDVLIVPATIADGSFEVARMALEGHLELPVAGDSPHRSLDVVMELRFDGTVKQRGVSGHLDLDQRHDGRERVTAP